MASTSDSNPAQALAPVSLPRITIKFCTQCKWMLRAAYFAQELLSTFSTSLGEVSLVPSTGGVFTVDLLYAPISNPDKNAEDGTGEVKTQTQTLWDRKTEGGFPETKELKKRVRDLIDPSRDLGHVDGKKKSVPAASGTKRTDSAAEAGERARPTGSKVTSGGDVGGEGKGEMKRNADGSVCEDCN
ncbi:hypothetical protein MMC08_006491 [Hypocenomyce scalaris]|nr:hypothetical protein [Hypocenomyce scalaris]